MKARLRELRRQVGYIPATLRLVWTAAPGYTLAWASLLIVQGLLPAAQLYLIRLLVDSLVAAMGMGANWENIQPVLLFAGLMAATIYLTLVLQSAVGWVRTAQSELTRDHLTAMVHEKSTAIDLAFYEMPEYHDLLDRARSDLRERPLALLESVGDLIQGGITLIAMSAILLSYGLWLPLLLVISTLPVLYVVLRYNLRYHRWWQERTVERRWTQYYDTLLTTDASAAEMRLFDLGPHFRAKYQRLRHRLRDEQLRLAKQEGLARLGAGTAALLSLGAAMAWMVWRGLLGLVSLGDIALLYQALNRGQILMTSLLGSLGRLYDSTLFLGNLFEFLAIQPQIDDPPEPIPVPSPLKVGMRFRNVTFRYPGSRQPVIENFDFNIPAGKIVAIVGANGAGKTTLVKLLCRFYDPERGVVEFDGIDLRNLPLAELRRMIAAVFQFPVPYLATVRDNIKMGDLAAPHSTTEFEAAARRAGAHEFISQLPKGYDTLLGKWFPQGVQLSGGQWQRLALARSFLREAPIMILDEPTSHLDSWAEADWFDRFCELAGGRTAILITHRFVTAKRADIVHVMDEGQIVESGSHQELLEKGGLYAQSWEAQIKEKSTSVV